MTTIETKIAKNGSLIVKINGQRSNTSAVEKILRDIDIETYAGGLEFRTDYGKTFTGAIVTDLNLNTCEFEKCFALFDELGN